MAVCEGVDLIEQYGWSDALAEIFQPHALANRIPGRVIAQHRDGYQVVTNDETLRAKSSGRLFHEARGVDHPAVGDWVALSLNPADGAATIHAVLPRRTAFVRRAADSVQASQVIAANIDVAFVVTSLNTDLNPRRIERYLAAAWQSGARPVVVLTKADLLEAPQKEIDAIVTVAAGCPVLTVSARQGQGLDTVMAQVARGETCVLIGSSGVGKSTLVNLLLGEEKMATRAIRQADDQGRHTTSHRQLFLLPGGGLILDTPGIREVGLVDAEEGVSDAFDDIERLIEACKFNDCGHGREPGCAVRGALDNGVLDPARWAHFQKLGAELATVEAKAERVARETERRRMASLQKAYRTAKKNARGGD